MAILDKQQPTISKISHLKQFINDKTLRNEEDFLDRMKPSNSDKSINTITFYI